MPPVRRSQAYIHELEDEIKQLKSRNLSSTSSPQPADPVDTRAVTVATAAQALPATSQDTEDVYNHDPWFVDYKSHDGPVYIGEAACTGFTTRCRQAFAAVTGVDGKHIVRTHYISDQKFSEFSIAPCPWPTYNQATLLARVVQGTIGSYYTLCRWDVLLNDLKKLYSIPTVPTRLLTCKLYTIFALGEAYFARSSSKTYPGLLYFLRANREVSGRPERPRLESIEIAVMLVALYSLILNRRDASYFWIGSALRMSMTQGMHHSIPQHQAVDATMMEHRTRLWWTVYVLDRMSSAMMSHPISIPDADIDVRLPMSPETVPALANGTEVIDHEFLSATITMARILGDVVSSLYTRAKTQRSSLHRVQTLLKSLQSWHDTLPKHLQLPKSRPLNQIPRPVATMHLWFNQSIILTTRPVLLYVLQSHLNNPQSRPSHPPSSASTAFAETCIRCARENIRILTGLWVQGSFSTFAYFYSNYLFSAGVTLGVASQLPSPTTAAVVDPETSTEGFEFALQTLKHLSDCGNLPAKEFHKNLDALKAQIAGYEEVKAAAAAGSRSDGAEKDAATAGGGLAAGAGGEAQQRHFDQDELFAGGLDTTVFSEPTLQGFLAQPSFDLPDLLGSGGQDPDLAFLYTWPDDLGDVVMEDGMSAGL